MNTLQLTNKPTVLIFASAGGFSISLVEQLVNNFCKVIIGTSDIEGWNKNFQNLSAKPVSVVHVNKISVGAINCNYIIFISDSVEFSGGSKKSDELYAIGQAFNISKSLLAPSLYVFPYTLFPDVNLDSIELVERLGDQARDLIGTIFLGDIIGPRINFSDDRILASIIKGSVQESHVKLPKKDIEVFPISIHEASKQIIKRLFSFGAFGERIAVLSAPIKTSNLATYLRKIKPSLTFSYTDENFSFPKFEELSRKEYVTTNIEELLKETISWYFPSQPSVQKVHEENIEIPSIKFFEGFQTESTQPRDNNYQDYIRENLAAVNNQFSVPSVKFPRLNLGKYFSKLQSLKPRKFKYVRRHKKKILLFVSILIVTVISPFFLWAVAGVSLYFAKNDFLSGDIPSAYKLTTISRNLFNVSYRELDIFSDTPIVGRIFDGSVTTVRLSYDSTNLLTKGFNVIDLASEMSDKILGGDGKDIAYYSRQSSLELDSIYQELGFLEGEMSESRGALRYFYDKVFGNISLRDIRNKVVYFRDFVKELPELLGEKDRKVYLVLFQNNMELRPTGGFIGSFAFVTFDKGRLVDVSVQDVYDADGQLQGHVEPPSPIKDYLGEANWYLRDSNWDPDFPTSASRAEWFLDKELDTNVDGVISVDLETAKDLIDVFGSVKLTDFDTTVRSDNLYEITQKEVEEDFFPGSRKKSNFLTSLTRELLTKVTKVERKDYLKLSKVVLGNLDRRHIQLFLHPVNAQRAVSVLDWDGAAPSATCSEDCYGDYLEVNEANVGANKANYYISRNMSLDVNIGKDAIDRSLAVELTNKSLSSQKGGNYKSYVRLVIPDKSESIETEIVSNGTSKLVTPEITDVSGKKEVGVLVEVNSQSSLKIMYRWRSNLASQKSYELLWRKQAGTNADPILVSLQNDSLTNWLPLRYNTTLEKDFFTHLNF